MMPRLRRSSLVPTKDCVLLDVFMASGTSDTQTLALKLDADSVLQGPFVPRMPEQHDSTVDVCAARCWPCVR